MAEEETKGVKSGVTWGDSAGAGIQIVILEGLLYCDGVRVFDKLMAAEIPPFLDGRGVVIANNSEQGTTMVKRKEKE